MGKESTTHLLVEKINSQTKQEESLTVSVEFISPDYFEDFVF